MSKLSLSDLSLAGRRVFMRVDFNTPMSEGRITDDSRIQAATPSVRHVLDAGGRLILASHMGRPKGSPKPEFSLKPVRDRLAEILGRDVAFADDCVGEPAEAAAAKLGDGDVLLLENLRFHKEEEANDPDFARALASLADVYVNDAFGTAHRAHASTAGIAAYVDQAAAGFLMHKELDALGRAVGEADRPYVSIVGGAKISGKIELIENFLKIADDILIGGAMAYTFLRAQGKNTGKSMVEDDRVALAGELLTSADSSGKRIHLPTDHIVARTFDGEGLRATMIADTGADEMGLDIGPETITAYSEVIAGAKTVVWNGPMGVFENPKLAEGTFALARAVAASGAFSIVGGGDSAAAVHQAGLTGRISHVSTGGGAALEFLSGRTLPGVEALTEK
jgi:phosphoglycerate kinase